MKPYLLRTVRLNRRRLSREPGLWTALNAQSPREDWRFPRSARRAWRPIRPVGPDPAPRRNDLPGRGKPSWPPRPPSAPAPWPSPSPWRPRRGWGSWSASVITPRFEVDTDLIWGARDHLRDFVAS